MPSAEAVPRGQEALAWSFQPPGHSRSDRPWRAPIAYPAAEPSNQATMAATSTTHTFSRPSPASVPPASSEASPRAPRLPLVRTSTNMMMYCDSS